MTVSPACVCMCECMWVVVCDRVNSCLSLNGDKDGDDGSDGDQFCMHSVVDVIMDTVLIVSSLHAGITMQVYSTSYLPDDIEFIS